MLTKETFGTVEGASFGALTEFGKTISRDIDGRELARVFALELAPKVEGIMAYDIEKLTFD